MLGYLWLFFLLFSGSTLAAVALGRRAEETLPVTSMSVIALLYAFYCLDLLRLGFYVVVAGAFLCYGVSIFWVYRSRLSRSDLRALVFEKILTPGMLVFVLTACFISLLTYTATPALFDELRLWAYYPKLLYFQERLQLGAQAALAPSMQAYLPGMPLFLYFCQKVSGGFSDNKLYLFYALLGTGACLPALKLLTWKKAHWIMWIALFFTLAPLMIYGMGGDGDIYYRSLYIDPAIGLLMAYAFFLIYEGCFQSRFDTLRFCVALAVLSLMKDSGSGVAAVALLTACATERYAPKTPLLTRQRIVRESLAALSVIFVYGSWSLLKSAYTVGAAHAVFTGRFTLFYAVKFLRHTTEPIIATVWPFIKYIPIWLVVAGLLLLLTLAYALAQARRRKRLLGVVFGLLAASLAIAAGIYVLGVMAFEGRFYSFPRYIGTALLALWVFLVLYGVSSALSGESSMTKPWAKGLVSLAVCTFVLVFPYRMPNSFDYAWREAASACFARAEQEVARLHPQDASAHRVFMIASGAFEDDGYYYEGFRTRFVYEALGSRILTRSQDFLLLTDIAQDTDLLPLLTQWATDTSSYVIFMDAEEAATQAFGALCAPEYGSLQAMTLYQPTLEGKAIQFVPANALPRASP